MTADDDYVDVRLELADAGCDDIQVQKVSGRERISELFSFDVRVVSLDPGGLDAEAIAGTLACLVFLRGDRELRRIHGMIAEINECLDSQAEFKTYELRLVPRAFQLTLVETQEIFLEMSVPAIMKQKFEELKLDPDDFDLGRLGDYPERDMVVQYRESDLAFISRLAEHLGISYFFTHECGADKMVFSDRQETFPRIGAAVLRPRGEERDVYRLDLKTRIIPATYVVQDYNYRIPQVELSSKHELEGAFAGGVVEYGGHFKKPEEGDALARIRAEERQVERRVYTGQSDLPAFSAGHVVTLEGPHAVELLLISVEHEASRPVLTHGGTGAERHYRNTFRAIPYAHTYRPPRVTPRPRIHGLLSATIEHGIEEGMERWAMLDDWGRYTVRFFFDTAEHGNKQSRPIRMIQPHAGASYGVHFPLTPGVEVLLGFVDGDPDRPVIVGAVYRPDSPSPVTKPNNIINKIKSESGVIIEIRDA